MILPPWLLAVLNPLKPIGDVLKSALQNPYVIGGLVVVAFVVFGHVEEGRVSAAKAQVAKVDASWSKAFATERGAFRTVDEALKAQNVAVAALEAKGRAKTAQAVSGWRKDKPALDASLSAAVARPAPDPKGNAADEADAIFRARNLP